MSPNSCTKWSIFFSAEKPKCPAIKPTKSTNVTPNEMPKNYIFPKATPNAMTNAYKITVWATEASLNNRF